MSKKKQQGPQYYVSKINTQVVNYDVYVMNAGEKILYSMLLFLAGGTLGLVFYGGLFKVDGEATFMTMISNIVVFCVVGLIAIKAMMESIRESLKQKRLKKLKKQFVDFSAALTTSLSSGMNINDSLHAVYNDLQSQYSEDAYIVKELQEILNGISNNIPVEEMLEDFGLRSGIPDIVNFATVFSTCYRTGGDIKSVVRRTTEIISEKTMIASEIETTITSNKMQMNMMTALPVVIVLMMRFMSPDFAESFSSVIGVIGLTITVVLTIVAFKMGQKITNIKE